MMNEDLSLKLVGDFVKTHPHKTFHTRVKGTTMHPTLAEGEWLTLAPASATRLTEGDIVLAQTEEGLRIYRIIMRRGDFFLLKGDALKNPAPPVELRQILGKVVAHRPYPFARKIWNICKNVLTRWLSFQLCEMILESQSREI